jgi:hypothetical protein
MYRRVSLKDLKGRHHMGEVGVDGDGSVDRKKIGFENGNRIRLTLGGDQRQGLYIRWEIYSTTVSFPRSYLCVMCTGYTDSFVSSSSALSVSS